MEDSVRQRIMSIFSIKSTNPTKFSKENKAMQKRLSRQLNGGASVTFETISSILSSFPDISAEWLLRGEGEVLKSDNKNINDNFDKSQYVSKNKYESKIYLLAEVTNDLKETVLENKKLRKEIEELRSQLETTKSA